MTLPDRNCMEADLFQHPDGQNGNSAEMLGQAYAGLIRQLESLARKSDGALALLDRDQRVVLFTPGFASMFGISEHLVGCPLRSLLRVCSEQMRDPGAWFEDFEGRFLATPGQAVSLRSENSEGLEVAFAAHPVTDSELGCIHGWVVSAVAQESAGPDLLQVLGHEISLPLQSVISSVDLLARCRTSPEQSELLETMKASSEALSDAVLLIRSMSAKESLALAEEVTIPELMDSVASIFRPVKGFDQVSFQLGPDLQRPRISDPKLIRQILINLINNAIRHAQGQITVRAEKGTESGVRFSVSDCGPGIADEDREAIFGPAVSRGKGGGSGLGLYVSSQMVHQLGGKRLALQSSPEGSIFSFEIPMPEALRGESSRVLVIEDDETSRALLSQQIEIAGLATASAGSSEEAIRLWRSSEFSMALIDVHIPNGGEGIKLAEEMRQIAPERPLISISGLPQAEEFFLDQGFDAHIGKPVTFSRLEALLERISAKAQMGSFASAVLPLLDGFVG